MQLINTTLNVVATLGLKQQSLCCRVALEGIWDIFKNLKDAVLAVM